MAKQVQNKQTSTKKNITKYPNFVDYKKIINQPNRLDIVNLIRTVKQEIETLLANSKRPHVNFLWIEKISVITEKLYYAWGVLAHLNAVVSTPSVRKLYLTLLPKITIFSLWLSQNKKIYALCKAIQDDKSYFNRLNDVEQKIIKDKIRDFHLEGINLKYSLQRKYRQWVRKIELYSARFSNNVLDEVNDYKLYITDKKDIEGIPEVAVTQAKKLAEQVEQSKKAKKFLSPTPPKDKWIFTLQAPSYLAFQQYCSNEKLREQLYKAYITKASNGKRDNGKLIEKILTLRKKIARALGFIHYADLSLATKMASSIKAVSDFLWDLHKRSKKIAEADRDELTRYKSEVSKKSSATNKSLKPWDVLYYSQKLREHKFKYNEEQLKKYFPANKVLLGLFNVVEKLFDYSFVNIGEKNPNLTKKFWNKDVQLYALMNKKKEPIGYLYLDLYARKNKRSGAWMDECQCRYQPWHPTDANPTNNKLTNNKNSDTQTATLPIAYIVANFTPAMLGSKANHSLLSHQEVLTLFHEMGHAIHHLFTKMNRLAVSGIRSVPWDGVELPSQLMEHWVWQRDSLKLVSEHITTHKPIDPVLIKKLIDSKNFQSGLAMLRQIEFSLLDLGLHSEYLTNQAKDNTWQDVQSYVDALRKKVAVMSTPSYNRFQNSFLHIFAGGYASGYYSYKWAEKLSADAFSLFEEKGLFNKEVGKKFLVHVLEMGGGDDFMKMYEQFRGKKPTSDALLRHSGIQS